MDRENCWKELKTNFLCVIGNAEKIYRNLDVKLN